MIDNNSIYSYTKLKRKRKEIEKQNGSTVLVGTPERWFTLKAALTTYTNSEYNVLSSLFVNIERTPEHTSATFLHPVDKLDNEKNVELCHGALNTTNTSISSDKCKNLDDFSGNASLSKKSSNHMSDQNKIESENKRKTRFQKELTAHYLKGQTKHAPRKPFYMVNSMDNEVLRQSLSYFYLHDFVRKAPNQFFRNEQKIRCIHPSVPIPSMHQLLPYNLRYLDEEEPSEHHIKEILSAPTEQESQVKYFLSKLSH